MQVNYFARSSAPGAPTIAYEFEVDLDGKTLVGRNAAAKSVLTGKAAAPPAPPKPKPVKVKPKAAPKPPEEDTLDSMLGDAPAKPAAKEASAKRSASESETDTAMPGFGAGSTMTDTGDEPPAVEEKAPPARAKPARRAAKAKGEKSAPPDETLLDDLLKD